LIHEIHERLPEGRLFDEDFSPIWPERFFAAELVREAVIAHTRQEVPHGVAVHESGGRTEDHPDRRDHRWKRAARIDRRRAAARRSAPRRRDEKLLGGKKVYLELQARGWTDDPARTRASAGGAR
jgi:GTP-binding protein Era